MPQAPQRQLPRRVVLLDPLDELLAALVGEGDRRAVGQPHLRAPLQHHLCRALHQQRPLVVSRRPDEHRHRLALAVELERRQLVVLGVEVVVHRHVGALLHGRLAQPNLLCQHLESSLRALSDALPHAVLVLVEPRQVAQRRYLAQLKQRSEIGALDLLAVPEDAPLGLVGDTLHIELHIAVQLLEQQHLLHRHLVRRQRARLVRADDARAPERLDGRQVPNERVLGSETPRPEREAGRDDRGETLGDGGDSEHNRDLEEVHAALEVHAPVEFGLAGQCETLGAELRDVDGPARDADHGDDVREHVAELVQLLLQRALLVLGLGQRLRDLADLSVGAGLDHHAARLAVHEVRGTEHDVLLRRQLIVRHADVVGALVDGRSLAGEGSLLGLEGRGLELDDADVSGDLVADRHLHDVAGHQLLGVDQLHPLVAQHLGLVRVEVRERLDGSLRVRLLPDADAGVEDEDGHDDARLDPGVLLSMRVRVEDGEGRGDAGGDEKDLDHLVVELLNETLPQRHPLLRRQLVGPVDLHSSLGLLL
mmetsp:Transcript_7970/g.18801  ORF Transcript_7970/g.18801 Transcript_7970/m.18801 type:complete len:537 (-) Transcript_7970:515-2125(-)